MPSTVKRRSGLHPARAAVRLARGPIAPGAILAAVAWPGPAAADGEPTCPPVALIEGPVAIAAPTRAILREHGVSSPEARACEGRLLRATFLPGREPDVYRLKIDDGFGRLSDREAADPETAASLIESWLLDEDAALLAPKPEPRPATATAEPAAVAQKAPSGPVAGAPIPLTGWRLFGGGEISTDAQDALWYGGSGGACRKFGPICVGGRARLLRARGWQTPYGTELDESATDALLLAALPVRLGKVTVLPTAGVGLGWNRMVAAWESDVMSRDRMSLRGDLSVIVDLGLGGGWSLFAEVGTRAAQRLTGDDWGRDWRLNFDRPAADLAVRTGFGVGYTP